LSRKALSAAALLSDRCPGNYSSFSLPLLARSITYQIKSYNLPPDFETEEEGYRFIMRKQRRDDFSFWVNGGRMII